VAKALTNPFRYGDLALDEAFTDRKPEIAELTSDIRNGQNVVIFAPRRYGKSSLIWRVTQELLVGGEVLIAQVNLMKTPTKEQLAERLAASIYDDIATGLFRARERLRIFSGLRITPTITIDPEDGSPTFGFDAGARKEDIDATLERLFELPARLAADRKKRAALVFDEFQQIVDIDPRLPDLMRSIFQEQPEVAHVYLGSKHSMMTRIFNDENEPFWRSAKQMELGVIPPELFGPFIRARFGTTKREIPAEVIERILGVTGGHPYGTQELCYAIWEVTPEGAVATDDAFEAGLERVLRGENAHFSRIWEKASRGQRTTLLALAKEPLRPMDDTYRRRHKLPAPSTVQKALETLVDDELVLKERPGDYRIAEPFLKEWILRYEA
jgi:AAA+ ATPase superfamily predicted ATPase